MGNVTQTPTRQPETGPDASPATGPGRPDGRAAGKDRNRFSTGRNLEGHRWIGRPAKANTPEDHFFTISIYDHLSIGFENTLCI